MPGQVLNEVKPTQPARWWWTLAVIVLAVALIAIFIAASRQNRSVEETETLARTSTQRPTTGTPVATVVPLPAGDRDLERIGDRLAEAAVYLRARQHGPALRALNSAATATRQLHEARPDLNPAVLAAALGEFTVIEREIQRGEIEDARSRLLQVGRTLDVAGTTQ